MSSRRLIDDRPDALERSLLETGERLEVPQQPKARLIAGLAAGTALTTMAAKTSGAGKFGMASLSSKAARLTAGVVLVAGAAAVVLTQQGDPKRHDAIANDTADIDGVTTPRKAAVDSVTPDPAPPSTTDEVPGPDRGAASDELQDSTGARVDRSTSGHATAHERSAPTRTPAKAFQNGAATAAPNRLLREEALLVSRLRSAIAAGDLDRAETLSRTYWSRFAKGQLTPEVRALDERRAFHKAGKSPE